MVAQRVISEKVNQKLSTSTRKSNFQIKTQKSTYPNDNFDDAVTIDKKYELDAPKYFDFKVEEAENYDFEAADDWFAYKKKSPASVKSKRSLSIKNSNSLKSTIASVSASIVKAATEAEEKLDKRSTLRYLPTRSVKPLTIPKEFNFSKAKEKTILNKTASGVSSGKVEKTKTKTTKKSNLLTSKPRLSARLAAMIKANAAKKKIIAKKEAEITIPKPFQFHSTLKNYKSNVNLVPKSPFKPLVLKIKEFEETKPDRFKTEPKKSKKQELTAPKSPMLLTKIRSKKTNVPSSAEIELQEMKAIKPFKASKLNRKVYTMTQLLIKTYIIQILDADHPLGVPPQNKLELTCPVSPAIQKPKPKPNPEPALEALFKANPVKLTEPFEPVYEHKHTKPLLKTLPGMKISKKKLQRFKEELRKKEEEELNARNFVANPIRSVTPDEFPEREVHYTDPEPFFLKTDERGEIIQQKFKEKLCKEEEERIKKAEFHANAAPKAAPFYPEKSSKPVTEPENVVLHTEIRGKERKAFDDGIKKREEEDNELKELLKLKQQEEEKVQIKELREHLVHVAQPIRHFAPTVVAPSQRKLTEPESPM
ncbi:Protein tpx2, partial [Clydaea vesicula]